MSEKYNLIKTEADETWDQFVTNSPDGSIFSLATYLNNISDNVVVFYCLKNNEKHAGVVLIETADGKSTQLNNFLIYSGILLGAPKPNQTNISAIRSENFKVVEFISAELASIYQEVKMTLPVSVVDIRPLLWYNYGTDLPQYQAQILYTSYLRLDGFSLSKNPEEIPAFKHFSVSRRQEVRYAAKKGVVTKEEFKPDLFVNFYKLTMERQGKDIDQTYLDHMKKLITALMEKKLARMFVAYTAEGEAGSMVFIGTDQHRAHYIFGANDPKFRNTHTGSAVLWDAFHHLGETGVKEINLEGVNSPHRGWFKLSFGGDIRPYYRMSITNK
jgi:hypothetical protein